MSQAAGTQTTQPEAPTAPDVALAKLPSTGPLLIGRDPQLAILDEAWADPNTNVVTFVAFGGVGKTAVVNKWLSQIREDGFRGAERVYGWSFYSQGTSEDRQASGDEFIAAALTWFGDPDSRLGSPWDKGERLARLVREKRTLLILDGLEPLQYPPGEHHGADERGGRLRDPGVQSLLRELAIDNQGLCIVSTRLAVDDLKDFEPIPMRAVPATHVAACVPAGRHEPRPARRRPLQARLRRAAARTAPALRINLEDLTPAAGAALLDALGVQGSPAELEQAARDFDGHALALTLLGNYLKVVHHGDVRKRDEIPKLTDEPKQGGHARRVMECYERWFAGKPELSILRMLGLFDRPAIGGAIEALRAEPPIENLTTDLHGLSEADWKFVLHNLRQVGLLAKHAATHVGDAGTRFPSRPQSPQDSDPASGALQGGAGKDSRQTGCEKGFSHQPDTHQPDTLDCHPLIREHFADKVRNDHPEAWREGHNRLYEYFKGPGCTKELPNTLDEMAPLFAAVTHGCHAGRYQNGFDDVFASRITRWNEFFSTKVLGAFGAELAALSGFFDSPWRQPVDALTQRSRLIVLNAAGFHLRALGRLREAAQPMRVALESGVAGEYWVNAANAAANLSELSLALGYISQALEYAQESVALADETTNAFLRETTRTVVGNAFFNAGRSPGAETTFREVEQMQKRRQPGYPILYSLRGFQYCDLLLDLGDYRDVSERAAQTLLWVTQKDWLLDMALDHLSLGRARLMAIQREGSSDFAEAEDNLRLAVDGLRQARRPDYLPRGLLARAEYYRLRGEREGGGDWFDQARRDVDEAMLIATRGQMRLHECDCHLEYARLHLAQAGPPGPEDLGHPHKDEARNRFEKAKEMVNEMGYHRRDPDLELGFTRLLLAEGNQDEAREHLAAAKKLIADMGCHCHDKDLADIESRLP